MVKKVLIIDDDSVNNFLCERIIKLANFSEEVNTFFNSDTAIEFLKLNADNPSDLPEVIFLDINMPIKSGWDFLNDFDFIKSTLKKEVKIFMLSSSVYEEDVKKAKSYSTVTDYITKPLSIETLGKLESQFI